MAGFSGTEKPMDMAEIRYKGIIDWGGLYQLIRRWFADHKYIYLEGKYKDKVATPFGNELEIKAAPYRRITEFLKYNIKMEIKLWDYKEFETTINGEKKLVTDGRIYIKLNCSIDFDYNKKFKTDFEKKLLKWMTTILKEYYELKHFDNLTYSLYDLQKEIKEFLNMETQHYGYPGWPG